MNYTQEEIQYINNLLRALTQKGKMSYDKVLSIYSYDSYDLYDKMSLVINKKPYHFIDVCNNDISITELGKIVAQQGFAQYIQSLETEKTEKKEQAKKSKFYEKWGFWVGVVGALVISIVAIIITILFSK
jgi:hypothetical protein